MSDLTPYLLNQNSKLRKRVKRLEDDNHILSLKLVKTRGTYESNKTKLALARKAYRELEAKVAKNDG